AKNRYSYKGLEIEIYSTGRYSTLTGHQIPGTPEDVQDRQATILAFIERLEQWEKENTSGVCVCGDGDGQFQPGAIPNQDAVTVGQHESQRKAPTGVTKRTETIAKAIREEDLPRADQEILTKARAARNGQNFLQLWEGGDPRGRNDKSK